MTPQATFMICAAIREDQLEPLRALLFRMTLDGIPAHACPNNSIVPFGQFGRLHFARFIIIETTPLHAMESEAFGVTPRPWQPTLAFIGDIDGDLDSFLTELVAQASNGLSQIFQHCIGFPDANSEGLQKWMRSHDVKPAANYVNWVGRTVKQIYEEKALHECLSTYLPELVEQIGRDNTRVLRQRLLEHVEMKKAAGEISLTPPAPTPWRWLICHWLHKLGIPVILLLVSPLLLLIAPFLALWLRFAERTDPPLIIPPEPEHIKILSTQEDWLVSNQFNVFGDVRPSPIRRWLFRFIMLITDYTARHIFNRGFLTRIRTIHFARWVFLDDHRRAFFASHYDGSHESYMDDFINKVGWGLNLTFGNGIGYPPTRWLIKDGAYLEQAFKYTQRRHQFPSEVWYKAHCYWDLTVTDLARNTRIREGMEAVYPSDAAVREWLSLI